MSEVQATQFTIFREDKGVDPKTVVAEGLRIGRLGDSDVWLNHPQVSRLHAGINRIGGDLYLINLSGSSLTALNGRVVPFNEIEAITRGDEIQIGPFFLCVQPGDERVSIRVRSQFALTLGTRIPTSQSEDSARMRAQTGPLESPSPEETRSHGAPSIELSNALKVFWGKRTREKAGRPSPLHPRTPPRLGKVRFNWVPSRDLIRPWPFAIFVWAAIVVAALATLAAFAHKNAFAPDAISDPHMRRSLVVTPPIAREPSANSCTSCHALGISVANKEKMNARCAACHRTESFEATVIPQHRAAGINCVNCHVEHRGANFRPLSGALESCSKCHSDHNKHRYNDKSVHTPHGGTFGYPVINGAWVWKGLDAEELAEKPEVVAFLKNNRVDSAQVAEWRNAQFHGIHLNRIRVVSGMDGTEDENGNRVLSCSSCHKTGYMGSNIDRSNPRTTCGKCHNAEVFNEPTTSTLKADTPSCTSCHIQHVKDTHWTAILRVAGKGLSSQ